MTPERCATENELLDLAEGRLRPELRARVVHHLDECAECAELLAQVLRDTSSPGDRGIHGHRPHHRDNLGPHSLTRTDVDRTPAANLELAFAGESVQGLRVGRYLLLERLGEGAMGSVFTAYDPELTRTVALKLIHPMFAGRKSHGESRARLIREAQAAAHIEHPNLVTIYEVSQADGVHYIAMEYVKGQTVRTWMTAGVRPRPWRQTLDVFLQAGAALAAAHRGGVLHRDFKPDNIMLDDHGRVRVVDFGLAVGVLDDTKGPESGCESTLAGNHLDLSMTETGTVLGTPVYMAPEQHHSAKVDARADQYAFAASLYEALHGERPFAGKEMSELLAAKQAGHIAALGHTGVPGWLRAVVVRGLASDPDARWPDMPAMLAALQADPTRRRAGQAVAMVAGVALLAGFGWQTRQRAELEAACVTEGRAIEALWTAERIDEMRAAFEATGLPFAADAWRRVEGRIDRWVEEYVHARTELCRAGDLAGSVEPALLVRARACFDAHRTALADATRDWAAADIRQVTHAPGQASSFAALTDCTDFTVLARRLALERAEDVAEADRSRLRAGWQEARRLAHEGDAEGAQAAAHALADEAVALRSLLQASELALTECGALNTLSRFDAAQAACERSYDYAVRASDHEGAVHTAAALSSLASQQHEDFDLARLWLRHAENHHTFIAAPPGQPDDAQARLLAARAYLSQDSGEHDRALDEFRLAIGAYVQMHGEFSEHASYLWLAIAHIGIDTNRPETAREALDQAARIRGTIFGALHPHSIEVDLQRADLLHKVEPEVVDEFYGQLATRAEQTSGAESMLLATVSYAWGQSLHDRHGCAMARPKLEHAVAALERDPDTKPTWLPMAYLLTATCRLEARERTSAGAAALVARDAEPPLSGDPGEQLQSLLRKLGLAQAATRSRLDDARRAHPGV